MKIIGLTGGISTGKTTVLKIFSKLGIFTVSCDDVYHKLLKKDKILKEKLTKIFGKNIVENGRISRRRLYEVVLASTKNLYLLEKITHPIILKKVFDKVKKLKKEEVCVIDVPLLFEKKLQNKFDFVVVVYCSRKTQLERIRKRKFNKKLLNLLISNQMDLKEKIKLADFIIYNEDVSKKVLRKQIIRLLNFFYS